MRHLTKERGILRRHPGGNKRVVQHAVVKDDLIPHAGDEETPVEIGVLGIEDELGLIGRLVLVPLPADIQARMLVGERAGRGMA